MDHLVPITTIADAIGEVADDVADGKGSATGCRKPTLVAVLPFTSIVVVTRRERVNDMYQTGIRVPRQAPRYVECQQEDMADDPGLDSVEPVHQTNEAA